MVIYSPGKSGIIPGVQINTPKRFASKHLRRESRSSQTRHQYLWRTTRTSGPLWSRWKTGLSLLLTSALGASALRAAPLVVVNQFPAAGSRVSSLASVEVAFSAAALGVDAFDLLVNGAPATNLVAVDPAQYIFQFPQPPAGTVQITFSPTHGIQSAGGDPLVLTNWSYLLDTTVPAPQPILNEFMASNSRTLRDDDGDYSDWIELANTNSTPISLLGYHLSNQAANPVQWTFPDMAMPGRSYLVVFASGKDRAVAGRPLHTNFKLKAAGDYLALVAPDGTNILQQFAPTFPPQTNDISYGFVSPGVLDYMETPTPGVANVATRRVAVIGFSVASGTFISPFSLALTSATPGAVIYYTLNGSAPATNSLVYSNPIPINATAQIRAFGAKAGLTPGAVSTAAYLQIDAAAQSFSSDLPIVVLDSFGAGIVQSASQPVYLMTFEPDPQTGRASLTNSPTVAMRAGLHIRGSSSGGFPKHQFKLELWDESDQDEHVPLLGLPSESDWVLNGDYSDETLLRNPLLYDFGRELGLEAPRSRYSEVFLHTSGGLVRGTLADSLTTSYYGVLSLIEFIKIGKNRVDVDQLGPNDNTEPNVTGGYILRFEKDATQGPVLSGWRTLEMADPNTPTASQLAWISAYMNTFRSVVMGANYRNPTNGFRAYIDSGSVVNYLLVNELTHSQDAYVRSAYKWKARGGKLVEGPLWDYNLSFGLSCCFDSWRTNNWTYTTNPSGELYWNIPESDRTTSAGAFPMYERFLSDPDFSQLWVDRYQQVRQTLLRQDWWNARVDGYAAQIAEAQARNFTRWTTLGTTTTGFEAGLANFINISTETWPILVQEIKDWTRGRLRWMDAQFPAPVGFNRASGVVAPGTPLALTNGGSLPIYYTLDGTDPRASGGGPSPGAIRLTGASITLTSSVTLVARSFGRTNNYGVTNWSGPMVAHFYITSQPAGSNNLIITELNYHPAPPTPAELLVNPNLTADDFAFVELKNIGPNVIDLFQVRFTNGINFNFTTGAVASLAPGQLVLAVKNRVAFELRYGAGQPIAGEYEGSFNNAGEAVTLVDYLDQIIADFTYQDGWYPTADGLGFTLVAADQNVPPTNPSDRAGWRFSASAGGSPGATDPLPSFSPVVVNEVLTYPVPPALDTIELFNPTSSAVNVGGWFLTDDRQTPKKFRIPDGTRIASGGFLVFDETQFNAIPGGPTAFGLSSLGDNAYLFSADATGNLTGYAHGFGFGAAIRDVTFGRYVLSTGEEDFVLQISNTLGGPNAGPLVGPVVISEIMYQPPGLILGTNTMEDTTNEFVELHNILNTPVPLYDPAYPSNTWRLRGGIDFPFPMNVTLPAQGYLLVVNFDPVADPNTRIAFQTRYGLSPSLPLYGSYAGKLNNGGDNLELARPNPPVAPPSPVAGFAADVLVDKVKYATGVPWPCGSGGNGNSLQRYDATQFGNDPLNWVAMLPTPGQPTPPTTPGLPTIVNQPQPVTTPTNTTAQFNVTVCGRPPFFFQWFKDGTALPAATAPLLQLQNLQLGDAGTYAVSVSNAAGMLLSSPALLSVQVPPLILTQPASLVVTGYSKVTFSVVGGTTPPFQYQWMFNGVNLPGQTNDTLALPSAQPEQEGDYSVRLRNTAGTIVSDPARLSLLLPAHVVTQPPDGAIGATSNYTFTATVLGWRPASSPLFYQWRFGGVAIPGAAGTLIGASSGSTNLSYSITNATAGNAGSYSLSVSNQYGTDLSRAASLEVLFKPQVTQQPPHFVAAVGETVTITVTASGTLPLQARWRKGSSSLVDYTTLPGHVASLTLPKVALTNAAGYSAVFKNPIYPTPLPTDSSAAGILSVVKPPVNRLGPQGAAVTLEALVKAATNVFWAWEFNGANIRHGLNNSNFNVFTLATVSTNSLVLTNLQPEQLGTYTFRVTNAAFSFTTNNSIITTNWAPLGDPRTFTATVGFGIPADPPVIVSSPASRTNRQGTTATFTNVATATWPVTCSWFLNGTNLVATTNASSPTNVLTLTNVQPAQMGSYTVVISNSAAVVTSDVATLTVQWAPIILAQPQNQTVVEGGSALFAVAADGTQPLLYQWRQNGLNLAGATAATLTLPSVQTNQAGAYSVVVSNAFGTVTSSNATLRVLPNAPPTPLHLGPPVPLGAGQFQLTITGEPAHVLDLLASPDLAQWTTNATLTNLTGTVIFTNIPTPAPAQFYRARQQ